MAEDLPVYSLVNTVSKISTNITYDDELYSKDITSFLELKYGQYVIYVWCNLFAFLLISVHCYIYDNPAK